MPLERVVKGGRRAVWTAVGWELRSSPKQQAERAGSAVRQRASMHAGGVLLSFLQHILLPPSFAPQTASFTAPLGAC